jgi:hypothetical protein
MNFKDMLEKISQLSEATEKTKTGTKHTADAGGYGRRYDVDQDGEEKKDKDPAVKRGRGRPAKGSDDTGTVKKYDTKGVGDVFGGGKKPKKEVGTVSKKNTLKDWFEHMESKMLAEAEQVTMEPAKQNTQVIKQGSKTIGTVSNPQLAAQIKQSIGKGEMSLAGDQLGEEEENYSAKKARAGKDIGKPGKNFAKIAKSAGKKYGSKDAGERVAGAILAKLRGAHESVEEAEIPSSSGVDTIGAGLGAGRSQTTLEGRAKVGEKKKLPSMAHIKKMCKDGKSVAEICKMHPDCDQKELKQMVADCKKTLDEASMPMKKVDGKSVPAFAADGKGKNDLKKKKAVKEGMSHRLQAARLEGKAHGLKGHSHCGKNYQDMEEARVYHEGYKEGLDECYGQMPVRGLVGEGDPAATVPGMDSQEMETMTTMEDDMYEMDKTAYMKQQAIKTPGNTFKAFGQTMHDNDVLDEFAFEAWDRELSNLLTEGEDKIEEGMTVSISKGQQGAPDSVSISAQDAEAEHLLAFVKNAGLGLFGDDAQHSDYGAPKGDSSEKNAPSGIEVVGDHDGMMGMLQKLSGIQQSGDAEASDYADEEGHEDSCNECGGMMEAGHSCGSKEMVDEVESEDQMEFEVAEANAPDSGEAEERDEETTDATRDAALATAASRNFANTDAPVSEEEVDESALQAYLGNKKYGKEGMDALRNAGREHASKEKMANIRAKYDKLDEEDEDDKEVKEAYTFENMYKKIAMLSEESTSEKDDKAEIAAKKVAKDIEYDEDHKGKDDNRAEKAGEKVKKDIEYDDKKDKKEKIDEWANEAGPDKRGTEASFEEDIDFMMNVISGGLNKRKSTGQTTVPVVASQLNRTVSHNTTDINESVNQWKKLAGIIK